jgi:hypothetical protein
MRKIRRSSEAEMVYEFLKMEIVSERYAERIEAILSEMQVSREVVTDGNITDDCENRVRAEILGKFRGYKKDAEIFQNFPSAADWFWAVFGKEDLEKIIYIEYSYWNEISSFTGSPVEAAKTVLSGKRIFDVPNDGFIKAARKLKNGHIFPPLIFMTDENESRFIILEGHARMTAFCLEPEYFHDVPVLLGYCSCQELNKWYGEMPKPER